MDASAIRRGGGSLVLEQRAATPARLYRVHWAGPRTSDDQREDCGHDTDLMLSMTDANALAAAAGGFGADHSTTLGMR